MSTTFTVESDPAPEANDADRPRARIVKRVWLSVLTAGIVGFAIGGFVLFGWMANETHFDRPSQAFDQLQAQLKNLPGVEGVDKERWVEAPTFSNPTSWMSVTVDEAGVPGLLEAACSTDYPDAVTWSIRVRTPGAAEVLLFAAPTATGTGIPGERCPDFGFDAVGLIKAVDQVAPGLAVQPTIGEDGRFTLVEIEEAVPMGFTHLLPLIEHADDLLAAAGLGAGELVEINASTLGLTLEPGESDAYLALLTELSESRAVSSYWADSGGRPVDGVEKVQIVAPDEHHAAIEQIIRSSGLHIADLPLRFLEQ